MAFIGPGKTEPPYKLMSEAPSNLMSSIAHQARARGAQEASWQRAESSHAARSSHA